MAGLREAYVGIDAAKARNAVAIADEGRDGEVRYIVEFDATPESMRRLVTRLAAKYDGLHFCYEAGPTGYGLNRLIASLGHARRVVAPSLIPRKPSDRVKTHRRDPTTLARLLRAGELTAASFAVEIGDVRRFESPRQLMGYLGLVLEERSTGETVRRGPITKVGITRVRKPLVESAWAYRHPPRLGNASSPS